VNCLASFGGMVRKVVQVQLFGLIWDYGQKSSTGSTVWPHLGVWSEK